MSKITFPCAYCTGGVIEVTVFEAYCFAECRKCGTTLSAGDVAELKWTLGLVDEEDDDDPDESDEPALYEAG